MKTSLTLVVAGVFVVTFPVYLYAQELQSVQTTQVEAQQGRVLLDSDSNETDSLTDPGQTQEGADVFIKLDDIKGESGDDGDPDQPIIIGNIPNEDEDAESGAQHNQTDLEFIRERDSALPGWGADADADISSSEQDSSAAKKPKEIVVVGSKVRDAAAKGVEVRGWDPISKEVILKTEDIITEADLTDYATALLVSTEDVSSISVHGDVVGLTFDQSVKLFGLFPVAMTHQIDVSTDPDEVGRVKVRFPWWSFLTKIDISSDEIKDAVEEELDRDIAAKEDVDVVGTAQETRQFQMLSNTMKVLHDTAMAIIRKIG